MPVLPLPPPTIVGVPALLPEERGFEWLEDHDGVFVRQHVVAPLAVCAPTNRYMLAPLAADALARLPDELTNTWAYPVREQMEMVPVLHAGEVGDWQDRVCCPLTHGFNMDFSDAAHSPYFSLERASVCEPCCCWPVLFARAQALSVLDRRGSVVARSVEPVAPCRACWTRSYLAVDADGAPLYTLRASDCGSQTGCNFCAPTCFNQSYDVDVFAPDGTFLTSATWVYTGWSCAAASDRSNILIRFPPGSSAAQRAALVASMLLVDVTAMEIKRLHEGSGSAGARRDATAKPTGAPTAGEMER